jgi:tetratricopeptide (TPR) repeat protein
MFLSIWRQLMREQTRRMYFHLSNDRDERRRHSYIELRLSPLILAFILIVAPIRGAFPPDDYETLFDEGNQSFRKGNYDEALGLFQRANTLKNNASPECLLRLAQTYEKLGAYRSVEQTCDRLIQACSENAFYLSKALEMKGNALLTSATIDPEKPDAAKLEQAESAFRETLRANPGQTLAHYNLGLALIRLNRPKEGITELQAYLQNAEDKELAGKARRYIENPKLLFSQLAPNFSFMTSDTIYVTSDELRGKVVLLDFWNLQNSLCAEALPYLSMLASKYKSQSFVLVSINLSDPESRWRSYISQNKMDWTQAQDGNSKLRQAFQIQMVPTYILIDHEGAIRYRSGGISPLFENPLSQALKAASESKTQPAIIQATSTAGAVSVRSETSKDPVFRIPKPKIQIESNPPPSSSGNYVVISSSYTFRILNWASMPDDLFLSVKDLAPCANSINNTYSPGSNSPTRINILVMGQEGDRLASFCGMSRPEHLQSFNFYMTTQPKIKNVYVVVKDRITGNAAQSELIKLP